MIRVVIKPGPSCRLVLPLGLAFCKSVTSRLCLRDLSRIHSTAILKMGWTQGACYSNFHPSKCWIFQQVLFIEVLCHTDRLWSSTGMWLQCIWTTWRRTDSHTLCRSISCWGEHIEPLTFQEHNVCHIHPDRSNWTSWFDEFDQFLWSRHHCAVCSQSLKEPAVSLAAGLRHSLAVTGKFAQKNKTMCFHYAVNPQIQIFCPAFRLRLCISVGNWSFQSC